MIIGVGIGIGFGITQVRTLVYDSINRANSTTTLGTADTGQAWTNNAGNIGIISNQAYMPNAGTSIATLDSGASSVAVTFRDSGIGEASLFNGIVVRYSDTSNYVRVVLQTTMIYVQRRQSGSTTVIASNTVTRTDGDVYRIVASATSITVYQNGVNVATVAESFNASATRQGFIVSTTLARMDNFVVEAL